MAAASPLLRKCSLLLFSSALVASCFAQNNADETNSPSSSDHPAKFSAQVKVVTLLATVRDKHGQIINDLSKDDFTVQEDGHAETIKYFAREANLPLKLGLLVDTSGSVLSALPDERNASKNFLDQMVREQTDLAFVIHFDRQVELLQDFTSSRQKLESATDEIAPSPRDDDSSGGNAPGGGQGAGRGGHRHGGGGGTLLYDSVFLAADELMQKQEGRKALILLTDGEDRGSKTSLESAIESAQRANALVYCIYFKGEGSGFGNRPNFGHGGWGRGGMGRGGPGRFPQAQHEDGKKVLERMAKATGGRVFEISMKEPIGQIYDQIQQELRNQYSIGYTPDRNGSTASYHKIQLTVKQKDRIVQTRDGYYD